MALSHLLSKEGRGAQSRLSRERNIDRGYLNAIIKGRKPGSDSVRTQIAEHFNTTYEEMLAMGRSIIENDLRKKYPEDDNLKDIDQIPSQLYVTEPQTDQKEVELYLDKFSCKENDNYKYHVDNKALIYIHKRINDARYSAAIGDEAMTKTMLALIEGMETKYAKAIERISKLEEEITQLKKSLK